MDMIDHARKSHRWLIFLALVAGLFLLGQVGFAYGNTTSTPVNAGAEKGGFRGAHGLAKYTPEKPHGSICVYAWPVEITDAAIADMSDEALIYYIAGESQFSVIGYGHRTGDTGDAVTDSLLAELSDGRVNGYLIDVSPLRNLTFAEGSTTPVVYLDLLLTKDGDIVALNGNRAIGLFQVTVTKTSGDDSTDPDPIPVEPIPDPKPLDPEPTDPVDPDPADPTPVDPVDPTPSGPTHQDDDPIPAGPVDPGDGGGQGGGNDPTSVITSTPTAGLSAGTVTGTSNVTGAVVTGADRTAVKDDSRDNVTAKAETLSVANAVNPLVIAPTNVTPVDAAGVALLGGSVALAGLFALSLVGDIRVIMWFRKKKNSFMR